LRAYKSARRPLLLNTTSTCPSSVHILVRERISIRPAGIDNPLQPHPDDPDGMPSVQVLPVFPGAAGRSSDGDEDDGGSTDDDLDGRTKGDKSFRKLRGDLPKSLSTMGKFCECRLITLIRADNRDDPTFAITIYTVEPLFTYSIGQKWLYLLRKVLKSRYGFP
jgi:hypothetical protein